MKVKLSDLIDRQRTLATAAREREYEQSQVDFIGQQVENAARQRALYVRQARNQTQNIQEAFSRVSTVQSKLEALKKRVEQLREKKVQLEKDAEAQKQNSERNMRTLASLQRRLASEKSTFERELREQSCSSSNAGRDAADANKSRTAEAPAGDCSHNGKNVRLSAYMARLFSLLRARQQTMVRELSTILPIENHGHGRTIRGLHLAQSSQLYRQDLRDKDAVCAALGLFGHLLLLLSKYLNIPLRFRLRYTGASRCFIEGNFGLTLRGELLQRSGNLISNLMSNIASNNYNATAVVDAQQLNHQNTRGLNALVGSSPQSLGRPSEATNTNVGTAVAQQKHQDTAAAAAASSLGRQHQQDFPRPGQGNATVNQGEGHDTASKRGGMLEQSGPSDSSEGGAVSSGDGKNGRKTQKSDAQGPENKFPFSVLEHQRKTAAVHHAALVAAKAPAHGEFGINISLVNGANPNKQYPLFYRSQGSDFLCALELLTGNVVNLLHRQGVEQRAGLLESLEYFIFKTLNGL